MEWLILVLVIVAIVAAVAAVIIVRRRRSTALARRFGPEYDRAVDEHGSRKAGEEELRRLDQRRRSLDLRELAPADRMRYAERWRAVQLRFVDQPEATVAEADDLIVEVMRARGYPVDDPDDRTGMVVADHPQLADDYRTAHGIRQRSDRGDATVDELRDGFQRYRALFSRLLDAASDEGEPSADAEPRTDAASHWGERAGEHRGGGAHSIHRQDDADAR
jgi:hypothetical protein